MKATISLIRPATSLIRAARIYPDPPSLHHQIDARHRRIHSNLPRRRAGRTTSGSLTATSKADTSAWVSTDGKRQRFFASNRSSSQSNSIPSTYLQRNSRADRNCFWVATLTLRSTSSLPMPPVPLAVEEDVAFNPSHISPLQSQVVVPDPDLLPNLLQESGR